MNACRDSASAAQSSMASADADRVRAVQQRDLAEHVGGRITDEHRPLAGRRGAEDGHRAAACSTISDSPGSFSTNSSWPLR